MRLIRRVCLLVILAIVSSSKPRRISACWESELTTSLVSAPFYESYFSWLEEVRRRRNLSSLPSRTCLSRPRLAQQ